MDRKSPARRGSEVLGLEEPRVVASGAEAALVPSEGFREADPTRILIIEGEFDTGVAAIIERADNRDQSATATRDGAREDGTVDELGEADRGGARGGDADQHQVEVDAGRALTGALGRTFDKDASIAITTDIDRTRTEVGPFRIRERADLETRVEIVGDG